MGQGSWRQSAAHLRTGSPPAGIGPVAEDQHAQRPPLPVMPLEQSAQGEAGVGALAVGLAGGRRIEVGHVAAEADEDDLRLLPFAQTAEFGSRLFQMAP